MQLTETEINLLTQEESMKQTIGSVKFKRVIELLKSEKNIHNNLLALRDFDLGNYDNEFKEEIEKSITGYTAFIAELDLAIFTLSKHSK